MPQSPGCRLGVLAWPDAEVRLRETPVVILPFAAGAKQHGRHLPLDTDHRVLDALCEHAIAERDVVVCPPILHGWFPAFRRFPGTGLANADTLQRQVEEIGDGLAMQGIRRLLVLNTGVLRASGLPLAIAVRNLNTRHELPTLLVSWEDLETEAAAEPMEQTTGGHADEVETSILLHLDPQCVDLRVAGPANAGPGSAGGFQPQTFDRIADADGHRGEPQLASAAKGKTAFGVMCAELLRIIDRLALQPPRTQ